jgi:hypothetical protein
VLEDDDELRQNLRQDLGGLPAVPELVTPSENELSDTRDKASSLGVYSVCNPSDADGTSRFSSCNNSVRRTACWSIKLVKVDNGL